MLVALVGVVGALAGVLLQSVTGLFSERRLARTELRAWAREKRLEAFENYSLALDQVRFLLMDVPALDAAGDEHAAETWSTAYEEAHQRLLTAQARAILRAPLAIRIEMTKLNSELGDRFRTIFDTDSFETVPELAEWLAKRSLRLDRLMAINLGLLEE